MRIAIIGGGAAGFFLGAQLAPPLLVHIFEKAKTPLQKVKISGGGRCNVTNACFDPSLLVENYPRGSKELLSVFHRFQPGDTMAWFEERGVPLKIQEDMRIFPDSDNSMDIVECLIRENQKNNHEIHLGEAVKSVQYSNEKFILKTTTDEYNFDKVIFAPGAGKQAWQMVQELGHSIIPPVPSLFTFNCKDARIDGLQGTTFKNAEIKISGTSFENSGNLLITHWGFSGPAVLVLSAWGARKLNHLNYKFKAEINFIGISEVETFDELQNYKMQHPSKKTGKYFPFELTRRFWVTLLKYLGLNPHNTWQELSERNLHSITVELTKGNYLIDGKSTFKDEFVTAGGVNLKEINFKTMESRLVPGLYFAGEVLNIDAVTGGFNFQACWSESFIISESLTALM